MFECAGETEHSRHGGEKLGLSLLQPIRQGVHVLLTGVVGEADAQYPVQLLFGQVKYLQHLERFHQFQVITGFIDVVGELNSLNYLRSIVQQAITPRVDSTSCDDRSSPTETGSHLFIWLMKWSIDKLLDYYCLIDGHPYCHTKKLSSPTQDLIGRTNLISNSIPRDLWTCGQ